MGKGEGKDTGFLLDNEVVWHCVRTLLLYGPPPHKNPAGINPALLKACRELYPPMVDSSLEGQQQLQSSHATVTPASETTSTYCIWATS